MLKIYAGADHAGYELKNKIMQAHPHIEWVDLGTSSGDSVDYPDFAHPVAESIKSENEFGLLVCGSGQGMVMAANKHSHIRAALCWSPDLAEATRKHNNANILCLPARFIDESTALDIFITFINTEFEGGRHVKRIEKLSR